MHRWFGKLWRDIDVEEDRTVANIPNIGIDAGKSGLIILDLDLYKENYGGDKLQIVDNTVKAKTGGGGIHVWFQQPEAKAFGNGTGKLPEGIHIRGVGGYVVAPPSLHESGAQYEFVEGHSLTDLCPLPLPQSLFEILEAAQRASTPIPVNFMVEEPSQPDLTRWRLSDKIMNLINNGAPLGSDRSRHDQRVITGLVGAGATDDDIRAVFIHYAIGAKYDEQGDRYLAHSIGKARAWLADHSLRSSSTELMEKLTALRVWAQSRHFFARIAEADLGIKRLSEYQKTFIAVVNYAIHECSPRFLVSSRQLGEMTSFSHMTAKRHLDTLAGGSTVWHKDGSVTHRPGLNLIRVTDDPKGYGKWVDLSELLHSVTLQSHRGIIGVSDPAKDGNMCHPCNKMQQFADDHLADDAYISYPRNYAIKRSPQAEILSHGLNTQCLFVVALLGDHGELTRTRISDLTGLSMYSVGEVLRRLQNLGLLVVWSGRPFRYDLHPDFENRLEDQKHLLPSYGIGQLRFARNAQARAAYLEKALKIQSRMPDSQKKARMRKRRDTANAQVELIYGELQHMGIDPFAKIGKRRERRSHSLTFDTIEEWRTWGRALWLTLRQMSRDERYEKARILARAIVGEHASVDDYIKALHRIIERFDLAIRMASRMLNKPIQARPIL